MKAYILDNELNEIGEPFEIQDDNDFEDVEIFTKECGQKCCIKWDRSTDGQTGYWSPSGATFEPYWYE